MFLFLLGDIQLQESLYDGPVQQAAILVLHRNMVFCCGPSFVPKVVSFFPINEDSVLPSLLS